MSAVNDCIRVSALILLKWRNIRPSDRLLVDTILAFTAACICRRRLPRRQFPNGGKGMRQTRRAAPSLFEYERFSTAVCSGISTRRWLLVLCSPPRRSLGQGVEEGKGWLETVLKTLPPEKKEKKGYTATDLYASCAAPLVPRLISTGNSEYFHSPCPLLHTPRILPESHGHKREGSSFHMFNCHHFIGLS